MSHGASHGDLITALYGSVDEISFAGLGKKYAEHTRKQYSVGLCSVSYVRMCQAFWDLGLVFMYLCDLQ